VVLLSKLDEMVDEMFRRYREMLDKASSMEVLIFIMGLNKLETRLFELFMVKLAEEVARLRAEKSSGNATSSTGK
jgi:hypothetical protein